MKPRFESSLKLRFWGLVGVGALGGLSGCFQQLATDADSVPPPVSGDSTKTGPDRGNGAPLPAPFTDADIARVESDAGDAQCAYGSALCYQLCNSPSCALVDNSIPGQTVTAPILLADGGTTDNACDSIEAESMAIRARSCSQCHGADGTKQAYSWVMDDNALASMALAGSTLVVPGNPTGSPLYNRMVAGLYFSDPYFKGTTMGTPNSFGMPPAPGARTAAGPLQDTIVTPTSQDVSVIYEWILNCMPGAPDGGASQLPVNDLDGAAPSSGSTPDAGSSPVDAGRG